MKYPKGRCQYASALLVSTPGLRITPHLRSRRSTDVRGTWAEYNEGDLLRPQEVRKVSMVRQNNQVDVCVILLLSLLVTACGDDNDSPTGPSQNTPTGSSSMNGLQRLVLISSTRAGSWWTWRQSASRFHELEGPTARPVF